MSEIENDVRTLPVWSECPFALPKGIVAYKGELQGEKIVVFYDTARDIHVDLLVSGMIDGEIASRNFSACMNNLGGAAFEQEHPGQFLGMIKRQAQCVYAGKELSDSDKVLWRAYKRCNPNSDLEFLKSISDIYMN